jgi:hypothetical protein
MTNRDLKINYSVILLKKLQQTINSIENNFFDIGTCKIGVFEYNCTQLIIFFCYLTKFYTIISLLRKFLF